MNIWKLKKFILSALVLGGVFFGISWVMAAAPYDGGTGDGSDKLQATSTLSLGGDINADLSISSAANQEFTKDGADTSMSLVTITDATTPLITAAGDIRIVIPHGFPMIWDSSITTATLAGAASGKAIATVSYEQGDRILVINVLTNFVSGDVLTVSGLKFKDFISGGVDNLELHVSNGSQVTVVEDDKFILIGGIFNGGSGDGWSFSQSPDLSMENPTKLVFTTSAAAVSAGVVSSILTIQAQNASSALIENFSGNVTLSCSSGCASPNTMNFDVINSGSFDGSITTLDLVSGTASFYFKETTKGTPTISVAYTGLTSATQAQTVNATTPDSIKFATQPSSSAVSGVNFTTQPAVEILDSYGNRTTATYNVTLVEYISGSTPLGTLSATTNPLAATNGLATFAGAQHSASETIQLKATASGILTSVYSNNIIVGKTGSATQIAFITQPSTAANLGTAFATQPVLAVQDDNGKTITDDSTTRILLSRSTG